MSITYPAIPKPTSPQYTLHEPIQSIMDRPLPPLPLLQSPPFLQKEKSPKRGHQRNASSLNLPQPFENIRASSTPSTPSLPPTLSSTPPRVPISPVSSRRSTSTSASDTEETSTTKLKKRSTWFSAARSRSRLRNGSQDLDNMPAPAWTTTHSGDRVPYPLRPLLEGQKIPELWSETGECLVYLFPQSSNRAASFRIPLHLLSSSRPLLEKMMSASKKKGHSRNTSDASNLMSPTFPNNGSRSVITPPTTPEQQAIDRGTFYDASESSRMYSQDPGGPSKPLHLYFPTAIKSFNGQLTPEEKQHLVDIRNLFAFLSLQPLVSTTKCRRRFDIMVAVASMMKSMGFTNGDASTLGDAALIAFDHYLQESQLIDVRLSAEYVAEALTLAEAMKSKDLYDEAFVHAAGQYEDIRRSEVYHEISEETRSRLDKAHYNLRKKKSNLAERMTDFQFHSLFAGIAISKTADEGKSTRFMAWQNSFNAMRKFALRYYRGLHGSWPPRPTRKNQFTVGGWNRLAMKLLYTDMCNLYDFLVDRFDPTTRNGDGLNIRPNISPENAALRKLLREYDHSLPPVQPPAPFDVPLVPMIETINPGISKASMEVRNTEKARRLRQNETLLLLTKSHNLDANYDTEFMNRFKEFEYEQARNRSTNELMDMRYGHWIFVYAVIQGLPQLVMDAPGVRYSDGVEHFLCEPAIGGVPWVKDNGTVNRNWYGTPSDQMVLLPSDVVDHGFEAAYRRSHCWVMGEKWMTELEERKRRTMTVPIRPDPEPMSPLQPPPRFGRDEYGMSPQSPALSTRQRSVDLGDGLAVLRPSSNTSPATQQHNRMSQQTIGHRRKPSIVAGLEKLRIVNDDDLHEQAILSAPMNGSLSQRSGHSSIPSSPSTYSGGRGRYGSIATSVQWSNSMTTLGTYGQPRGRRASSSAATRNGPEPSTSFDAILAKIDVERNKRTSKSG